MTLVDPITLQSYDSRNPLEFYKGTGLIELDIITTTDCVGFSGRTLSISSKNSFYSFEETLPDFEVCQSLPAENLECFYINSDQSKLFFYYHRVDTPVTDNFVIDA